MKKFGFHAKAFLSWNRHAPHELGARYATGEDGLPKDERRAIAWYRRGALRGDPESAYDLGFMLLLGDCGPKDVVGATTWLKRAVADGHTEAARLLADIELGKFGGAGA